MACEGMYMGVWVKGSNANKSEIGFTRPLAGDVNPPYRVYRAMPCDTGR